MAVVVDVKSPAPGPVDVEAIERRFRRGSATLHQHFLKLASALSVQSHHQYDDDIQPQHTLQGKRQQLQPQNSVRSTLSARSSRSSSPSSDSAVLNFVTKANKRFYNLDHTGLDDDGTSSNVDGSWTSRSEDTVTASSRSSQSRASRSLNCSFDTVRTVIHASGLESFRGNTPRSYRDMKYSVGKDTPRSHNATFDTSYSTESFDSGEQLYTPRRSVIFNRSADDMCPRRVVPDGESLLAPEEVKFRRGSGTLQHHFTKLRRDSDVAKSPRPLRVVAREDHNGIVTGDVDDDQRGKVFVSKTSITLRRPSVKTSQVESGQQAYLATKSHLNTRELSQHKYRRGSEPQHHRATDPHCSPNRREVSDQKYRRGSESLHHHFKLRRASVRTVEQPQDDVTHRLHQRASLGTVEPPRYATECFHPVEELFPENFEDTASKFRRGSATMLQHFRIHTKRPELIFSGEYTKAMEESYHKDHLACRNCDKKLIACRYIMREEHPHCVPCYQQLFAHNCEECSKPIGPDYKDLSYKDRHWHEFCFKCSQCQKSLVDQPFAPKDTKIFCSDCYDNQFAARCDGCGNPFKGGMKKFEYKGKQWHDECFICVDCNQPIGNKSFIPRDDRVICVPCYESNYAQKCSKCSQVINKGGISYKNQPWHRECFVCTNCNKQLAGEKFTSKDEQPYCGECFGDLFAKRCCRCTKPITGIGGTKFISFEERHWHSDCFVCYKCEASMVGRGFLMNEDQILCPDCGKS